MLDEFRRKIERNVFGVPGCGLRETKWLREHPKLLLFLVHALILFAVWNVWNGRFPPPLPPSPFYSEDIMNYLKMNYTFNSPSQANALWRRSSPCRDGGDLVYSAFDSPVVESKLPMQCCFELPPLANRG